MSLVFKELNKDEYCIIYDNTTEETEKKIALLLSLGGKCYDDYFTEEEKDTFLSEFEDIEEYTTNEFSRGNGSDETYLICDDQQADEEVSKSLDDYIDECVLSEIPEQYQCYFDYEKFKQDCSYDGRGHTLNLYDGSEEYEKVEETEYYIYRRN